MADKKSLPLLCGYDSKNTRVLDLEGHACNLDLLVLRDVKMQTDRQRFRRALRNIGYDIGREIAKDLINMDHVTVEANTPLGVAEQFAYGQEPVLLAVIRASLPMWDGMQEAFPHADTGFVAASRDHGNVRPDGSLGVRIDYTGVPPLEGERLIIVDPMLATASSIIDTYEQLCVFNGTPQKTYIASAIAAPEGIRRVHQLMPGTTIITASLDTRLNEKGYIVPGLGDAGDLCFGKKQEERE